MMPAGMPVSRIATRSARGRRSAPARFGNTPGYSTGSSFGELGLLHVLRELASSARVGRVPSSFWPIGTMTSLNSGLPSRETCDPRADLALAVVAVRRGRRTRGPLRAAGARAPRRRAPPSSFVASVGIDPSLVSCAIGTWIAIVCTLSVRERVDAHRRRRSGSGAGSGTAAGRRGRRSRRGRRRTRRSAGRRTPSRRVGSVCTAAWRAPRSSASSAARCCTAGDGRLLPSTRCAVRTCSIRVTS